MSAGPPRDWPAPLRQLCRLLAPGAGSAPPDFPPDCREALASLAIERHRVAPLVAARLGDGAPDALRAEARANGAAALQQIAATARIITACRQDGVDPVVLKGWPLAARLFGAPGQRHARDLDLLVRPGEMAATARVLGALGFVPAPVYRLRGRLIGSAALRDECYDLEFHHAEAELSVELHWRTAHFPGWPEVLDDPAMITTQETPIGPLKVPAPGADLIYLAGHGAMHVWARLKWLVDIAWAAEARGPEALEADLDRARALAAWTTTALALRLAHRVFASPVPPSLETPPPGLARHEARCLAIIADPAAAPGGLRYRMHSNLAALRLAETAGQRTGVLRYAFWRRLRLGVAGLGLAFGCKAGPG